VDDQGNSRELHTQEALEAIDYEVHDEYKTRYAHVVNETCPVVQSPYFTTNILEFDKPVTKDLMEMDSFVIYICVEGKVEFHYGEKQPVELDPGEALLVPAMLNRIDLQPVIKSKLLEVYIG
jgi:mannose-6-phosphate isomerase